MEARSPGRGRGRGRGRGAVKVEPQAGGSPSAAAPAPAPASAPKKFEPKVVARRLKKEVKSEQPAEENKELQRLIQQAQEANTRRGLRRGENKGETNVTFGAGALSRPGFVRRSGSSAGGGGGGGGWRGPDKKVAVSKEAGDNMLVDEKMVEKARKDVFDDGDESSVKPISLPLRRPMNVGTEYSDDDLDEDAPPFNEDNAPPCAKELGLEVPNSEPRLLFMQLPNMLPIAAKNISPGSSLDKVPQGLVGKLRVYESGAIKLHLGEVVMNVHPGTRCIFSQEVVAINSSTKKCAFLGDVGQRLVVTPDMDGLLNEL